MQQLFAGNGINSSTLADKSATTIGNGDTVIVPAMPDEDVKPKRRRPRRNSRGLSDAAFAVANAKADQISTEYFYSPIKDTGSGTPNDLIRDAVESIMNRWDNAKVKATKGQNPA